jgi:hypothetical protein
VNTVTEACALNTLLSFVLKHSPNDCFAVAKSGYSDLSVGIR